MKTKNTKVADTYLALIRQHPLKAIRTAAAHTAAMAFASPLLARDESLDAGERDYLVVLTTLIHEYEQKAMPMPASSPAERLRFLMTESDMTQAALAAVLGVSQPAVNHILSGNRGITTEGVKKLADHFRVSPAYFI